MRHILVAGGGGYIGSVLCEELLTQGHKVRCLDRFFFGRQTVGALVSSPKFSIVQDDIRSVSADVFDGIDTVIDLAGISNDPSCDLDPQLTEDINFKGNVRFAALAKKSGVSRFLYSSSCSIYGAGCQESLTEESALNPVSLYAKKKIQSENELQKMNDKDFCVTILRNATVYGFSPRMRFDLLINIMTAHAVTNGKIFVLGGGKQWRPNIHVRDVSRAFILILESPVKKVSGEVFNVGFNDQNYQVIQVANIIREVIPHVEIEVVPDDVEKRNYNVNFDKIKKELSFKSKYSVLDGVLEVKRAIETSVVDFTDIRTVTLKYYKFLIDADKILNEIKMNGRVF